MGLTVVLQDNHSVSEGFYGKNKSISAQVVSVAELFPHLFHSNCKNPICYDLPTCPFFIDASFPEIGCIFNIAQRRYELAKELGADTEVTNNYL